MLTPHPLEQTLGAVFKTDSLWVCENPSANQEPDSHLFDYVNEGTTVHLARVCVFNDSSLIRHQLYTQPHEMKFLNSFGL